MVSAEQVTAEKLAEAYKKRYSDEFSGHYDRTDHERICQNWLDRLPDSFAMSNWAGKMSRAYCDVLGKPFPKVKSSLLKIMEIAQFPVKAKFVYPNYGTPDGCPDYTAHSGQVVTVVRQATDDECDPECQPMYLIRADDGWEGHANLTELETE